MLQRDAMAMDILKKMQKRTLFADPFTKIKVDGGYDYYDKKGRLVKSTGTNNGAAAAEGSNDAEGIAKAGKAVYDGVKIAKDGGKGMPWYVDFDRGIDVTKKMISAVKKGYDEKEAKEQFANMKNVHKAYKENGGTKSFNNWAKDKGYMVKTDSMCSVM